MIRLKIFCVLAISGALAAVGCGSRVRNATQPTPTASNPNAVLKPGDTTRVLTFDGRERNFVVHVSSAVGGSASLPLVIVLHGGGGSAEGAMKQTGMTAQADQGNFIVVYPNGTGNFDDKLLTWNSGNCCGYALDHQVDDVGFIRALIAQVARDYPIDSKRIFVTGISNGGMMSYRVACELSDQVAAIAPVAGALNNECKPASPVSLIAFHGSADENVPYNGGAGTKSIDPHSRVDQPVSHAMNFWSNRNGCSQATQRVEKGNVVREEYAGCGRGTAVVLYTLKGGGHAWPGGERMALFLDPPFKEISATNMMWQFFIAHPKE